MQDMRGNKGMSRRVSLKDGARRAISRDEWPGDWKLGKLGDRRKLGETRGNSGTKLGDMSNEVGRVNIDSGIF